MEPSVSLLRYTADGAVLRLDGDAGSAYSLFEINLASYGSFSVVSSGSFSGSVIDVVAPYSFNATGFVLVVDNACSPFLRTAKPDSYYDTAITITRAEVTSVVVDGDLASELSLRVSSALGFVDTALFVYRRNYDKSPTGGAVASFMQVATLADIAELPAYEAEEDIPDDADMWRMPFVSLIMRSSSSINDAAGRIFRDLAALKRATIANSKIAVTETVTI